MGRRMRPLDPSAGPVERLASELRALRAIAGDQPFWKMARRCGVSKSALAAATAGRQLPSEKVTREFIRACGGDWSWWRDRWLQAVAELAADSDSVEPTGGSLVPYGRTFLSVLRGQVTVSSSSGPYGSSVPAKPGSASRSPERSRQGLIWGATVILTSAALMIAITLIADRSPDHLAPRAAAKPSSSPAIKGLVPDGTDPKPVGCFPGLVVLESIPVLLQEQAQLRGRRLAAGTRVGTISLVYSAHCGGAWAAFDPRPGLNPDPNDTTVGATTIEADRPADNTEMLWKMGHIDSTYSGILLTGMGCVIARARVDMVGQNVAAVGQTHCLPHRT